MGNSELTFYELTKDLPFIRVIWNGKIIYDDTTDAEPISLGHLYEEYGRKIVYDMRLKVVSYHHCELDIRGEKF